jgi:hypothetical protein
LESEGTEVAVEQFYADILARNTNDDTLVLIENQYGWTNHDHLGKVLTYLSGLQAQTIIWVSEQFHEAHLSAVRWLNEHTTGQFAFFAVRIKVLRIGDDVTDPVAPLFEVLERPSEWDRRIRVVAQEENTQLTERRKFRYDFWRFYDQRHPGDVELRPDHIDSNVYHDIAGLVVSQHLSRNRVGIYIRPRTGDGSEESELRVERFWEVLSDDGTKDCLYVDTRDRQNWTQMADWLHDRLKEYQRVLTES